MRFQIEDQTIEIYQGNFCTEGQNLEINDKTLAALILFLESEQKVISKDQLLASVWQDIIVSDASIFKQIQILRTLFLKACLPEDTIENVYGKGYRLKYPARKISDKPINSPPNNKSSSKWLIGGLFALLTIAVVLGGYLINHFKQMPNKINDEQKSTIIEIAKNDWQKGLDHINGLLYNNKAQWSQTDIAYLTHQKGQAELNLQLLDESLITLNKALLMYENLDDSKMLGDTHLQLSRLYNFIDDKDQQLIHINTAIKLYKAVKNNVAEIDAYLELAYIQKKSGAINEAIETYQTSINRAQSIGDRTGEMLGINNLAATYLIINDNKQALTMAEQGLAINLELGNGQHIANSYSFLSQLQQQLGHTTKAIKMIEQALKYQLKAKSHSNLSPKLMALNYLLLETFQHQELSELLNLTATYAQSMNIKGGVAIITLYQGMEYAHNDNWTAAENSLADAWQIATSKNFTYKKPLIMAYLALANSQNNNHLKAIELANQLMTESNVSEREMNLTHLALAISYTAMENDGLASEWTQKASESTNSKWLFDHLTWLKFKQRQIPENQIEDQNAISQQIKQVGIKINELAQNSRLDGELFEQLKSQVQALIDQKST